MNRISGGLEAVWSHVGWLRVWNSSSTASLKDPQHWNKLSAVIWLIRKEEAQFRLRSRQRTGRRKGSGKKGERWFQIMNPLSIMNKRKKLNYDPDRGQKEERDENKKRRRGNQAAIFTTWRRGRSPIWIIKIEDREKRGKSRQKKRWGKMPDHAANEPYYNLVLFFFRDAVDELFQTLSSLQCIQPPQKIF